MPCYTIRQTAVSFEKTAYKPGHLDLMAAALDELGYQVQRNGATLKIWPKNTTAVASNTIAYGGGVLQVPSTLKRIFTLDKLKEAYSRQAVRLQARRNGWLLREGANANEFVAERR